MIMDTVGQGRRALGRAVPSFIGTVAVAAVVIAGAAASPAAGLASEEPPPGPDVHTLAVASLWGYTPNGFPEQGGALNREERVRGVAGVANAAQSAELESFPLDLDTGASASVDLAGGSLGVVAHITATTRTNEGYVGTDADAIARVVDTITLGEPATVEFRGVVEGVTTAHMNDMDYGGPPRGYAAFEARFSSVEEQCGEACDPDSVYGEFDLEGPYTLDDGGGPVGTAPTQEQFSESIHLPAGTTRLDVELSATLALTLYGYDSRILTSGARLDFGSTATFEIVVPETIAVTSGSGLLPIVGGAPPVEDTTPPSVSASVSPQAGPSGWHTGAEEVLVTLAATDEAGGSGARSITHDTGLVGTEPVTVEGDQAVVAVDAEGVTVVTFSATDHAGNISLPASVTIRIDRTAPVLTIPADMSVAAPDDGGVLVSFDVAASDNLDAAPATQCTPASGATFVVGTTTVRCTATDAAGNAAEERFAVTVALEDTDPDTPQQQLQAMREHLDAVPMRASLRRALDVQLQNASSLIDRRRLASAALTLAVFEAQVILLAIVDLMPSASASWLVQHSRQVRADLSR